VHVARHCSTMYVCGHHQKSDLWSPLWIYSFRNVSIWNAFASVFASGYANVPVLVKRALQVADGQWDVALGKDVYIWVLYDETLPMSNALIHLRT